MAKENEEALEWLKAYNLKEGYTDTDRDIWETVSEAKNISRFEYGQHRWWNDYEYVVKIEDKYFRYIGAEANRDESMSDLGWDYDISTIYEVYPIEKVITTVVYEKVLYE